LVLGGRNEGDEGHALVLGPGGHLRGEDVLSADFSAVLDDLLLLGRDS
jgi:hypothetical protein